MFLYELPCFFLKKLMERPGLNFQIYQTGSARQDWYQRFPVSPARREFGPKSTNKKYE